MKRYILFFIGALFLVGCSPSQTNVDYTMPTHYTPVVYEIEASDPYEMDVYVISGPEPDDPMQQWRDWRTRTEARDSYETRLKVLENLDENDWIENEEDRIEKYCEDYGYRRCSHIDRTCEDDGCHRVFVLCEDEDFDPERDDPFDCTEYDVIVREWFDQELTKQNEAEVCTR